MLFIFLFTIPLFILHLGVLAYPHPSNKYLSTRIHGKRSSIPTGFVHDGHPHPDENLKFTLTLASHNNSGLERRLYEVSDPRNPMYGQYLSIEEVDDHVRPSEEVADAVLSWLESHGITEPVPVRSSGHVLSISVPISLANEMFSTTFAYYRHEETGSRHIQTMEYQLPEHLVECINHVHPTTQFPVKPLFSSKSSVNRRDLSVRSETSVPSISNGTALDIATIQELYDLPTSLAAQPKSILGVLSYSGSFSTTDLETFAQTYDPEANLDMVSISSFDQAYSNMTNPVLETSLDMEVSVSLATGSSVVLYEIGDLNEAIKNFIQMDAASRPNIITHSYGYIEADLDFSYADATCSSFLQLSTMGVSILTSSGDSGVGASCTEFTPLFPASCPYVTAVGATAGVPEIAASYSGGGFSNYFPMPAYQTVQVNTYLDVLGDTYSGLFNGTGRAYPDISAVGETFAIVSGEDVEVLGTSVSSPTVAGVIATLNNMRIANGQPVLGFLNTLLYSGGITNDITLGSNPGCGTNGFQATFGWDPVTGVGSPNFQALLAATL